ncbi:uncharacterized protein ASPGLDRAFT_81183 [Aspergillus glaucus CBS 516.65]|uniref:AMP-dependent synthetase/ligase domain-containing protein n=1 Tax=Aspergillus glaucus CBS 516.65 TaxID=1160497 RepID=A0A1L9VNF1_ASPGL|nr:hypothetical protein ASPGLDRAFT_81183 [Aspergillus glaucus CBS 516.65]OJJ85463.1 hypothetical protein ASPGLDRAFT_81183 [Aspergillus glaucus CBS 516.65]
MSTLEHGYLPDDPLFVRLLWIASQCHEPILNDRLRGVQVDFPTLLRDILVFRQKIRDALSPDVIDENGMVARDGVYIGLLATASHEYIVAVFAIAALGAAIAPLPPGISTEETLGYINLCGASVVLVGPESENAAAEIQEHSRINESQPIQTLFLSKWSASQEQLETPTATIQPGLKFDNERPGLLLFTSGSTGAPKAVIHARRYLYSLTRLPPRVGKGEVHLCVAELVSFTSGFHQAFSGLLRGTRIEMYHFATRPELLWNRLKEGDVTTVCLITRMWWDMMVYYQKVICQLPQNQAQEYVQGVRHLRAPQSAAAMPPPLLKRFWKELLGKSLLVTFGTTESGVIFLSSDEESGRPEANVGKPAPYVTIKLTEGDRGELWVKNSTLMLGYMGKEKQDQDIFDEEGFYCTNDVFHRDGDSYVWDGRAKSGWIWFEGHPVLLKSIEDQLLELPYVEQGHVLALWGGTTHQVAALVRFQPEKVPKNESKALNTVRQDLSGKLPETHLPTVLRILHDGEDVRQTWTMKTALDDKEVQRFFPSSSV